MRSPTSSTIRVLHVEDDPAFADLAATFLTRENGSIEVESVESAEAGLSRLEESTIDCVVCDYDMPAMDGLEFLEVVRDRYGDLPFVLFTGKGSEEIASEAISAGVTDYIQKQGGSDQYAVLANRIENAVHRYRTEQELERTRRRYELLSRASADTFWDWDVETGVVERSEGYSRLFGFDPEEVGDDTDWWLEQVHPDDRDRVRAANRSATEGDANSIEVDYRIETPDGTLRDVYSRAWVVRDEEGEAVRIVGTVTDVTDLRRRERELEAVSARLELVLDGTDTGVWEWTPATDEVVWDETVERLFGVPPGEFEGTYAAFRRRVHEEDVDRVETAIERGLDGEEHYDEEFRIRRDDGEVRWVHAEGVTRVAPDDQTERFVGLISDVTQRKDRERELEQYETIMETMPDGVFVLDENGVIEGGNEVAARLLGYSRTALLGKPFEAIIEEGIVEPGVVDRYLDAVQRLLAEETDDEPAQFEFTARVDDEQRRFQARVVLRPNEETFRGTIGIIQDITARREREEQLRRSERRFEAIFDDPSAFIGLLEPDGSFVMANDTALEFIGASIEDVRGDHFADTPWWQGEPSEKRAEIEAAVDRAAAGEFVRFEGRHEGVDGHTIWVEGQIRPVTDDGGEVVSILVEAIDVTDRLEQEQRITGLHQTTRELVRADDAAEIAAIVSRATADILDFPKHVVRLREGNVLEPVAVSSKVKELVGDRPVYTVNEGYPGEALQRGEAVVIDEFDTDVEEWRAENRSSIYVPIGDRGTISIGSEERKAFDDADVTVARILANNAAVALERLDRDRQLREREQALRRQNERLDRFASVLSHDLRNPLSVAMGSLELIETDDTANLASARDALDRMADLVDDVLALARNGERVVDPDPVDLGRIVTAAWETVETEAATLSRPEDLGTLRADGSRLQRLLENLFGNAIEHAGPAVTVSVGRLERADDGFYVEDDGPGIPPADRDHVFEFGWSTTEAGTGMGLAIAKEIAEAHGWQITPRAREGGGVRFEVTGVETAEDPAQAADQHRPIR